MKQFLINGNINWKDLRRQKGSLQKAINMFDIDHINEANDLVGILHLIDNIQDNAVNSDIWTEKEVFDTVLNEEEEEEQQRRDEKNGMNNLTYLHADPPLKLDDWTLNEDDCNDLNYGWTQICEKHRQCLTHEGGLDPDIGSGICGVKGCKTKSDHYLDFDKEDIKES